MNYNCPDVIQFWQFDSFRKQTVLYDLGFDILKIKISAVNKRGRTIEFPALYV